jgi:hypothetical protein
MSFGIAFQLESETKEEAHVRVRNDFRSLKFSPIAAAGFHVN